MKKKKEKNWKWEAQRERKKRRKNMEFDPENKERNIKKEHLASEFVINSITTRTTKCRTTRLGAVQQTQTDDVSRMGGGGKGEGKERVF